MYEVGILFRSILYPMKENFVSSTIIEVSECFSKSAVKTPKATSSSKLRLIRLSWTSVSIRGLRPKEHSWISNGYGCKNIGFRKFMRHLITRNNLHESLSNKIVQNFVL